MHDGVRRVSVQTNVLDASSHGEPILELNEGRRCRPGNGPYATVKYLATSKPTSMIREAPSVVPQ